MRDHFSRLLLGHWPLYEGWQPVWMLLAGALGGAPGLRPLRVRLFQNQFAKIDFHRLLTVDS